MITAHLERGVQYRWRTPLLCGRTSQYSIATTWEPTYDDREGRMCVDVGTHSWAGASAEAMGKNARGATLPWSSWWVLVWFQMLSVFINCTSTIDIFVCIYASCTTDLSWSMIGWTTYMAYHRQPTSTTANSPSYPYSNIAAHHNNHWATHMAYRRQPTSTTTTNSPSYPYSSFIVRMLQITHLPLTE